MTLLLLPEVPAAAQSRTASQVVNDGQNASSGRRLYLDGINLNDALLRYYRGVSERVLQEEHYRWWTTFGVKVEF